MFPKFEIFGEVFYSYPLVLGLIWAMGIEYSRSLNKGIPRFSTLLFTLFIAAWVGAKILFLVTLDEDLAQKISSQTQFWLGGGFVFLGGLIAGLSVIVLHKLYFKTKFSDYEFLVLPLALGHSMGRVGCFLAGCCFGGSCDLPWAVHMQGEMRHPVQLYESFGLLALFIILRWRYQSGKSVLVGYLMGYLSLRFFLEFFRGDKIRGIYWWGLSTSQIICIAGVLGLILLIALRKRFDISRT